jgi:uncharacterized membrane protein YhaH (DUF805 family)
MAGEPFYRDLFRLSGRRRRGSYFNFLVAAIFLSMVIMAVVVPLSLAGFVATAHAIVWGCAICLGIVNAIVAAQRCRDFAWTGWVALFIHIPLIGWLLWVLLLFRPGTQGPNKYGPNPLEPAAPIVH